jgi:lysine-N-methylase
MDGRIKVEIFDKFKCTADQCDFTCCRGWDISVDPDTYDRWTSDKEQTVHFNNNVRSKKHGKKLQYSLKMDPEKGCPFFNKDGLCGIVLEYGENYQPKTCRIFPRQDNVIEGIKESSLTCACPAVVDMLFGTNGQVQFLREGDTTKTSSLGFKVREAMINLIQDNRFAFRDKLMLTLHMLLSIRDEKNRAQEIIKNYRDESYLQSVMKLWEDIDIGLTDSYQEVNELFIDIVQNYRKEKTYRQYLQEIYIQAADPSFDQASSLAVEPAVNRASSPAAGPAINQMSGQASVDILKQWKSFSETFRKYGVLMENILVTKLFSNCNCKDIDDIIMGFQLAVTEYLMVRHSVFLSSQQSVDYTKLRDFIVIYSRIIEYNSEGIREFWLESFDEAIWELGYLLLLIG